MLKILLAMAFLSALSHADGKRIAPKPPPELASIMPIPLPNKKDEMVRFLACDTENECLKLLQQADLTPSSNEETFVAEFVETPKKGIAVYRRKVAQAKQ